MGNLPEPITPFEEHLFKEIAGIVEEAYLQAAALADKNGMRITNVGWEIASLKDPIKIHLKFHLEDKDENA